MVECTVATKNRRYYLYPKTITAEVYAYKDMFEDDEDRLIWYNDVDGNNSIK
ncbi:MAG: hypothetical protein LUG83_03870 [Lachnospiraceae bacterium]|nr:hypothetical protein [Lachnospiraceae bacterium]